MDILIGVCTVIGTIIVIALVVFAVFRHEIRKEGLQKPHRRTMHDTAYGKDEAVTGPATDAGIGSD
ncbi:hypothetical protein ACEWPM_004510 [Roseovarius sp. S4756]|uniref:hypothetical protein n=1 Tax=Roseovarius maritimus TaxID=3342637 RepID=UPI003726A878